MTKEISKIPRTRIKRVVKNKRNANPVSSKRGNKEEENKKRCITRKYF